MRLYTLLVPIVAVSALRQNCTCSCPCKPDGTKLKDLINCFATWGKDVATDENSKLEGCEEKDVIYCRTTNSYNKFCKFDGTNNLQETKDVPDCYYSCGMLSCTAWLVGHDQHQVDCIVELFSERKYLR